MIKPTLLALSATIVLTTSAFASSSSDSNFTSIDLNPHLVEEREGRIITDVITMDHIPLYVQIEQERKAVEEYDKKLKEAGELAALEAGEEFDAEAAEVEVEDITEALEIPEALKTIPPVPASDNSDVDLPMELSDPITKVEALAPLTKLDSMTEEVEGKELTDESSHKRLIDSASTDELFDILKERYMGHLIQALSGIFVVALTLTLFRRKFSGGSKG